MNSEEERKELEERELKRNDVAAREAITGRIPHSFFVPYVGEELTGQLLGTREKISDLYVQNTDKIARYLAEMRKYNPGKLPNDELKSANRSWLKWISNPLTLNLFWGKVIPERYAKDVKGYDCSKLLKAAKRGRFFRTAFGHGQVSPWNLKIAGDALHLSDFSFASNKFAEHHDPAHKFARDGITYEEILLAYDSLMKYIKYAGEKSIRNLFSLSAVRTIGELRDTCSYENQFIPLADACRIKGKNLEKVVWFADSVAKLR